MADRFALNFLMLVKEEKKNYYSLAHTHIEISISFFGTGTGTTRQYSRKNTDMKWKWYSYLCVLSAHSK